MLAHAGLAAARACKPHAGFLTAVTCWVRFPACRQQMLLEARQASVAQQTAVDPGVRMIVVSWMVEVAEEFRLQQETLHAAVLLLDRFMANSEVTNRPPTPVGANTGA